MIVPLTAWIPNGANPRGIAGSWKAPGFETGAKLASHTSTLALWKSVAYSCGPAPVSAIASPLKIAPGTVTAVCAAVDVGGGGTAGFQPVIVPASEENRKRAGPELAPECTTKPVPPLNTVPVGAPPGIETVNGTFTTGEGPTAPEYSVETSVPLSATHAGVVGPNDRPQAFTRLRSVSSARPGMSETRLRSVYRPRSRPNPPWSA